MARFTVTIRVAAPVDVAWAAIVNWPAHGRWIPLTRVTVLTDEPGGVGARFVGRTGIGPLGFDDPMVITDWRPPVDGAGECWVRKEGRLVHGTAGFTLRADGDHSVLAWTEDVTVPPARITRLLDPIVNVLGAAAFRMALRGYAREVELR